MGHLAGRVAGMVARRPAVGAAVLLMVGIMLHRVLPVWIWVWMIIGVGAVVAAGIFLRRSLISSALLALAIVLGGCASAEIANWYFAPGDVGEFASEGRELAWVEGTVLETPRWVEAAGQGRPVPDKQMFAVKITSVLTWKGWVRASGH